MAHTTEVYRMDVMTAFGSYTVGQAITDKAEIAIIRNGPNMANVTSWVQAVHVERPRK